MRTLSRTTYRVAGLAVLGALAVGACGAVVRSPGEQLLVSKCGACHPQPAPERFDRAGWSEVLERHDQRVPLSDDQRGELMDHLAPP